MSVSATVSKMWTSFAVSGSPGFNLTPWTHSRPTYISINLNNVIKEDYTKDYHVALEEFLNKTEATTAQPPIPTTTAGTPVNLGTSWVYLMSVYLAVFNCGIFHISK